MVKDTTGGIEGAKMDTQKTLGTLQETRDALALVRTRVLLHLAERLGPVVDRIETGHATLSTRDLVVEMVERQIGSPAEIRASFIDLIGMDYAFADRNGDVYSEHSSVGLLPHGLVAARLVQPDVSKLRQLRLVLNASKRAPEFAAKFDTGRPAVDKKLNASGLTLVCFYLLAIEQPSLRHPVALDWFAERIPCFAIGGLGPKSGPGNRLEADKESISGALELLAASLRGILPLQKQQDEEDGRRVVWFLDAVFPEVRMVVPRARADLRDWRHFATLMAQRFWDNLRAQQERERGARSSGAGATGAGS